MTRNGHPVVGLGQVEAVAPVVATASPWGLAFATSIVGAATGWCLEEIARKVRGKKKRRR